MSMASRPNRRPEEVQTREVRTPITSPKHLGVNICFRRAAEIYGEGEPAEYLYKVVSGTVLTYKVRLDGRRQVADFYLRGETFGLESAQEHAFSAEAIVDTEVIATHREALISSGTLDNEVARELWALTNQEI